jgi:hypothetical protein
MKKTLLITLMIAFVSTAVVANPGGSFELSKADTSQASLLQSAEGQVEIKSWGIPCIVCEFELNDCLNSGGSSCFQDYIKCLRICTGPIP